MRINRREALISAALLPFSRAAARDGDPVVYTGEFLNGHGWGEMNETDRLIFVSGFSEGISAFSYALEDGDASDWSRAHQQTVQFFSASKVTLGDIRDEISRLYADPANAAIPIAFLYPVGVSIFKGLIGGQALEQRLSGLRRTSQTLSSATAPR